MLGFAPLGSTPLADDGAVGVIEQADVSLSGSGSVSLAAKLNAEGLSSFSATSSASFAGGIPREGSANLSSVATISLVSEKSLVAEFDFTSEGSAGLTANLKAKGFSSQTSVGSIESNGLRLASGSSSFNGSGTVVFLEDFRKGGKFEALVGDFIRITESKDTRITEEGDIRVAENVQQNIAIGTLEPTGTEIPFVGETYAKYQGNWELSDVYVKYEGQWVQPLKAYKKVSGNWKRIA